MSAKINVGGVETFSTVDFPEHMAAVVFLQGCPWRCPFCHNTSLQPIDAETDFVWEKFLGFLEKRRGILDAVVFSGGEPLVQNSLEAALDDVNVGKFAAYLHRMTDHTQFISITHRRGTMEQGDVLYGVTMEEEGISKLLRLDVAEMEKKFGKSLN